MLRLSAYDADVAKAQAVLAALGYATGTVDGLWGSKTALAVEAFRAAQGIGDSSAGSSQDDLLDDETTALIDSLYAAGYGVDALAAAQSKPTTTTPTDTSEPSAGGSATSYALPVLLLALAGYFLYRKKNVPALAAGLAGGALLMFRKPVALLASNALDAANAAIFRAAITNEAAPYAEVIRQVAKEQGIDPFILMGLGQLESRWGAALKQGTGDWMARSAASWGSAPSVLKVQTLPAGWTAAKGATAPFVIPADGLGWGRGIMQIDYGSFYSWLSNNNWRDPYTNVTKGAQIYQQNGSYLLSKGLQDGTDDFMRAAIAAYNAGAGRVWNAIKAGVPPESVTYTQNYVGTIQGYISAALTKFKNLLSVS